jgi:LysM repeat protein
VNNKTLLLTAGAVVLIGFMISRKKKVETQSFNGYDTSARNDTLFIPTSVTNIDYVAGNQSISNSDSRSNVAIGDNSNFNNPVKLPVETVKPPSTTKYKQITKTSSIFSTLTDEFSDGTITAQRVEVLQENPTGWLQIKTWKGVKWVKDGYVRPTKPLFTNIKIQKGDSMWSLFKGDNQKIQQVAKLNGISDVNKIVAGANLKVPV